MGYLVDNQIVTSGEKVQQNRFTINKSAYRI